MADHKPLTVINGAVSELPAADSLDLVTSSEFMYKSGWDYAGAVNAIAPSTVTLIANTLRAFPIFFGKAVSLSAMRVEITAVAAATAARFGLYTNTPGDIYPKDLIADSEGVINTATSGVSVVTPTTNIVIPSPGLYWLAMNSTTSPTMRARAAAAIPPIMGLHPAMGASVNAVGYSGALAFGSLPERYPSGQGRLYNVPCPLALWRIA
jgi:hypothetical protein